LPARHRVNSGGGSFTLVTRLVFLGMSRVVVTMLATVVYPIARLTQPKTPIPRKPRRLLIGAGSKGWELIEYQEIFASASEYLGSSNASRLVFSGKKPMLAEFCQALREVQPSHYYFDPRSGSQMPLRAAWEALAIGFLLERYRVTPVCALTDFPVRRWRLQAAMVSARSGVAASLMSPSVVGTIFPHKRIVGPLPFPLSVATLKRLHELKRSNNLHEHRLRDKVVFVGMLYEPRKTTIEAIQTGLAKRGIPMEIIGRKPDGSRIPDNEYWDIILNARLVVCTSSQIADKETDFDGRNHFIYKFIEVTAAGTALAIEPVEGSEHLLQPDVHYIAYCSVEEAVAKIASKWESPSSLDLLAQKGNEQAATIIGDAVFWRTVLSENA